MRHVVFVDDDRAILSGFRRMLHSMRGEWRMTFFPSAEVALEALAADPPDVVISDMRMFGMDGAEFLTVIRRRWPGSVRMILSGYAGQGAALRSITVAHRFLSKPCEPATLMAAVSGACDLQDRLFRPELRALVGGLDWLPVAPSSYAAITEALGHPDVSAETVASIIERDPGCAIKLLQLVNSAFFGLARSVTDVQAAVAYLGLASVRNVVLASEVADLFRGESPEVAKLAETVNRYSTAVAAAARERVSPRHAQDAFVAGILHDVGRLTLAKVAPERFLAVEEDRRRGVKITIAEQERLGATHAEIGGYLLLLWGLPFSLVQPVARHHDPDAVDDADPVVAAVAEAVAEQESHSG
jgi:HD-like signal output (HDOD) protein